jgi:SpoVK/Ycf46/Vps4 family AAA+-type ATPase
MQIGVTFGDIGALGKVKNTLFELVILPLVRPELFVRGNLTKPLKGMLSAPCSSPALANRFGWFVYAG